jgi:endonuclease YncB( thermonuclease family)
MKLHRTPARTARSWRLYAGSLALGLVALLLSPEVRAEAATKVLLNGVLTPVYFNDGDSFRVLDGPLKGTRARLKGFNTLESYGPVHQWGTWTREELSRYSKIATLNARKGTWVCTSDMDKDGYGRILWDCQDLAVDQIRRGLAHALTVTKDPAEPALLAAQQEAIEARRGFWAHGVPDFILTSTHSNDEGYPGRTYNRLVSSADGHSEKWYHLNNYGECHAACQPGSPDMAQIRAFVDTLFADEALSPRLTGLTPESLSLLISGFVTEGNMGPLPDEKVRIDLEQKITLAISSGRLTEERKPLSCLVYVAFKRRYGGTRAECLR